MCLEGRKAVYMVFLVSIKLHFKAGTADEVSFQRNEETLVFLGGGFR